MAYFKNRKFIVGLFSVLSLITLSSLLFAYYLSRNNNNIIEPVLANTIPDLNEESNNIFVEVKGSVKKPGVYEVADTSIINDVISLAGGFTKNSWTDNINLSKRIKNELVIYVFTKSEYKALKKASNQAKKENVTTAVTKSEEECVSNGYLIDNCTDKGISVINASDNITPIETNEEAAVTSLININTAPLDKLMQLPGIGEAKAKAIIEYRNTNPFLTTNDIVNVSGISEKIYESLKELITV